MGRPSGAGVSGEFLSLLRCRLPDRRHGCAHRDAALRIPAHASTGQRVQGERLECPRMAGAVRAEAGSNACAITPADEWLRPPGLRDVLADRARGVLVPASRHWLQPLEAQAPARVGAVDGSRAGPKCGERLPDGPDRSDARGLVSRVMSLADILGLGLFWLFGVLFVVFPTPVTSAGTEQSAPVLRFRTSPGR